MTFGQSVKSCLFEKYATFSGTAARSEYWWFFLFQFAVGLLLGSLEIFPLIFIAVFLLPGLAVSVRRLRDIGKSGWWMLLIFVPAIGVLVLLFMFCMPTKGAVPHGRGSEAKTGKRETEKDMKCEQGKPGKGEKERNMTYER